jgi:hypothetical protein
VPRGFGFAHHSTAILYHEVPNPNITIRNFFIAVGRRAYSVPAHSTPDSWTLSAHSFMGT